MRTHQGGTPSFRFRKFARERREIDREDAQDRHDHHDGAVARHERLGKKRPREVSARDGRPRFLFERRRERWAARRLGLSRAEHCGDTETRIEQDGPGRADGERQQEGQDQDRKLGDRNLERFGVRFCETSSSDDEVYCVSGLSRSVNPSGVRDEGGKRDISGGRTMAVAQTRLMWVTDPPSRSETKAILASL